MNIAVDARTLEPQGARGASGPERPPTQAHVIGGDSEALDIARRLAADFRTGASERDRAAVRPLAELDAWLERFRPLTRTTTTSVPGPAGRLDALDTEMARGRRLRRDSRSTDEGDSRARTTG